jgi:hypothetical protein
MQFGSHVPAAAYQAFRGIDGGKNLTFRRPGHFVDAKLASISLLTSSASPWFF